MLSASQSGCINHPAVEATYRCKQCGTPVCGSCVVSGPTGSFCSPSCKEKNENYLRRAKEMDGRAGTSFFVKFRSFIGWLIVLVAVVVAAGVVATVFEIPVVSALTRQIRNMVGI